MGVVDLSREFWVQLLGFITEHIGTQSTWIHCVGGHGRTGTALAIIAHLTGQCGEMDPIEWVRKHYCKECIESTAQIEYIEDILDIVSTGKPPAKPILGYPSTNNNYAYNNKQYAYYDNAQTPQTNFPTTVNPIYTYNDIPNDKQTTQTFDRLVDEITGIIKKATDGDVVSKQHLVDEKVYFINNKKGYRAAWGTPIHRTLRTAEAILQLAFDEARNPTPYV
jgi:hypothetical protein